MIRDPCILRRSEERISSVSIHSFVLLVNIKHSGPQEKKKNTITYCMTCIGHTRYFGSWPYSSLQTTFLFVGSIFEINGNGGGQNRTLWNTKRARSRADHEDTIQC
jgi:hypothetical protein